jgi:hypothetical protein
MKCVRITWLCLVLATLAFLFFSGKLERLYTGDFPSLKHYAGELHGRHSLQSPAVAGGQSLNHSQRRPPPACAIILEPRASLAMLHAVRHMSKALPSDWPILVYHMADTRNFLHCSLFDLLESGKVETWEMEEGENVWKIQRTLPHCYQSNELPTEGRGRRLWTTSWGRNLANYFHFSRSFYATLPSDKYLIFQPDGLLCSEKEGGRLQEFLKYDMIGAPWNLGSVPAGGNGGFSLRSRAAMLKALDVFTTPDQKPQDILNAGGVPEDGWFSERLVKLGAKLPLPAVASSFSVEQHMHPQPLGFHKPWLYLKKDHLEQLYRVCPVLKRTEELMGYF